MLAPLGDRSPAEGDREVAASLPGPSRSFSVVQWSTWLALSFALVFVVVTVLVVTGVTQSLDWRAVHYLRPNDGWGDIQRRYSPWMSRLTPQRMFLLLAATSVAMSLWRRSWWPVAFGAALTGTTVVVTAAIKFAIERPDPHGYVTASGGSYPSGHVIAVVVCTAGCLLVTSPKVRWWLWTPVVAAAGLITVALMVAAAHWATDVVGGMLLALALVAGVSRRGLRRRAHRPRSSRSASVE
jgi:membrane-associated phospholipid phosphatase